MPATSESEAMRCALYDAFAELRADRSRLLKPGERWLTPADTLQRGDAYLANDDWWKFDGDARGPKITDCPVPSCYFCYTPKGSATRAVDIVRQVAELDSLPRRFNFAL